VLFVGGQFAVACFFFLGGVTCLRMALSLLFPIFLKCFCSTWCGHSCGRSAPCLAWSPWACTWCPSCCTATCWARRTSRKSTEQNGPSSQVVFVHFTLPKAQNSKHNKTSRWILGHWQGHCTKACVPGHQRRRRCVGRQVPQGIVGDVSINSSFTYFLRLA